MVATYAKVDKKTRAKLRQKLKDHAWKYAATKDKRRLVARYSKTVNECSVAGRNATHLAAWIACNNYCLCEDMDSGAVETPPLVLSRLLEHCDGDQLPERLAFAMQELQANDIGCNCSGMRLLRRVLRKTLGTSSGSAADPEKRPSASAAQKLQAGEIGPVSRTIGERLFRGIPNSGLFELRYQQFVFELLRTEFAVAQDVTGYISDLEVEYSRLNKDDDARALRFLLRRTVASLVPPVWRLGLPEALVLQERVQNLLVRILSTIRRTRAYHDTRVKCLLLLVAKIVEGAEQVAGPFTEGPGAERWARVLGALQDVGPADVRLGDQHCEMADVFEKHWQRARPS
eukprot:TRINITY_DN29319_c0_g1_i2.p1 TRINITY_DN29319_c0_g1~~TRINITY_DN29319_c0_g1_i2.p1  ORF type:complete len:359 (+),score=41.09 TRINITY_DN29319_c0_g1_i2:47-1078(+)